MAIWRMQLPVELSAHAIRFRNSAETYYDEGLPLVMMHAPGVNAKRLNDAQQINLCRIATARAVGYVQVSRWRCIARSREHVSLVLRVHFAYTSTESTLSTDTGMASPRSAVHRNRTQSSSDRVNAQILT